MISRITRSLSARLLAIFLLTSIVYAFASRYIVDLVLGTGSVSEVVGAHMALHMEYLLDDIGQPPRVERARAIAAKVPMDIMLVGPDLRWSSSEAFPSLQDVPFQRSEFLVPFASTETNVKWVKTVQLLEFARFERRMFVKIVDGPYQIIFASPKFSETPPPDLTTPAIGIVSILVLAGCYFAVRWLVSPIKALKEGTTRIGQGDLDYRIPVSGKDDLGELAIDINHMADDVRAMLEAKRQLLLAISHELRSPLTRAKVALEFLEDQSVKTNLMQDIKEMERLIADLLESERLNTRHSKLQVAPVDLADLAAGVLHSDFPGQEQRVELSLPPKPAIIEGDATRLRLLVKNLVENALRYTPANGRPIELAVTQEAETAQIQVCDHGHGMSAHDLARITEPFYRADPARSRSTGGLGLGLYLCRRIAEAHGGSLAITSELGCGTEVTVRLPSRAAA
jgi:signal transduction histidine kinase